MQIELVRAMIQMDLTPPEAKELFLFLKQNPRPLICKEVVIAQLESALKNVIEEHEKSI